VVIGQRRASLKRGTSNSSLPSSSSPGERRPPAKDIAAVLGVNINTVLRALRQLRDEGLLEFRRGRGITVTGKLAAGYLIYRREPREEAPWAASAAN
jgi:DNA-binding transcriptional regulator YhcF (GntR family)